MFWELLYVLVIVEHAFVVLECSVRCLQWRYITRPLLEIPEREVIEHDCLKGPRLICQSKFRFAGFVGFACVSSTPHAYAHA
jgi:hypothetical protein